ncbi:MAG: CBS domain-containing protein [Candidatus Aenigmarchaeota archaeon]|nr:CBS domain-containing protein [Candidatus Aenigmarchaeota archaeon]
MKLEDVVSEPLTIRPGEPVSKVAAKLLESNSHEALLVSDGKYLGMVTASDLARRRIDNPSRVKVDDYAARINPVLPGTPISEVISTMVINDYKALPVKLFSGDKERVRLVTKTDLLKLVAGDGRLRGLKALNVMSTPYFIDKDDYLSTARSMMNSLNISSLVVVDKGRFEGTVEPLDMLKAMHADRLRAGLVSSKGSGRRDALERVSISFFANKGATTVGREASVREIITSMCNAKARVAVVMDGTKAAGVITPKDILRVLSEETKGVYTTISGLDQEDTFIKSVIDEEISHHLGKLSRMVKLDYFYMHAHKYHKKRRSGEKMEYEIKAKLITSKGAFFSTATEWDATKAVRAALDRMEKEIIKRKEKGLL